MKNHLVVIDGGNNIGATSFFLEIDGVKILLDCGKKRGQDESLSKFEILHQYGDDPKDIDLVFLSHGHYDHMGFMKELYEFTKDSCTFLSTAETKELIKFQFVNMEKEMEEPQNFIKKLKVERIIQKIETRSFFKVKKIKGVKFTLVPAGHMMGASMLYIEGKKDKILYTGDFSFKTFGEINKINLKGLSPNYIIMNSTYGYKKYDTFMDYSKLLSKIEYKIKEGLNINLISKRITKKLDIISMLKTSKIVENVYLKDEAEKMADKIEEAGFKIYSNKIKKEESFKEEPHIIIGEINKENAKYREINIDKYSLHASYDELEDLVDMLNPSKVFIVHTTPNEKSENIVCDLNDNGIDAIQCVNWKKYDL